MARAATVSESNWNTAYISQAVVNYFQESFGMKATTSVPPPSTTPPPTTKPPTTTTTAATSTITATHYGAQSNTHADGFGGVGGKGGAWLEYAKIDFGAGVSTFKVNVAALAQYAGSIQIHLDSPTGTEIGSMKMAGTGAWSKYVTQTAAVKGATGVHNLYLVFVGGVAVGNVQSFTFTSATATTAAATLATSTIQAVAYTAKSGAAADGFGGMGGNGGNWIEYGQINFGAGVSTFKASVAAVAKYAGSYQLRLDSPTGALVGTLKIASTGAYDKYVTESTAVKGAAGIHNLYLVFVGGGGVGNIKSFSFA
jgi:arabinoxylan arabinofuranohydrolase